LQDDPLITGASEIAEEEFVKQYPNIYNHLLLYKKELLKRNQSETGIRYEWYAMQRFAPNYYKDFAKPKLVWLELSDQNKFAYSDTEDYILAGAFFMISKSPKYLLAFLNSKLCKFYFKLICNSSGMATTQWKKFALEKVPVPQLGEVEQKPFIDLVDKILIAKKSDPKADTKALESQIDTLVYQLYSLTPDEIKIIESQK